MLSICKPFSKELFFDYLSCYKTGQLITNNYDLDEPPEEVAGQNLHCRDNSHLMD